MLPHLNPQKQHSLPIDHFEIISETFDDGRTLYFRQLTGPQQTFWVKLYNAVFKDRKVLSLPEYHASLILASLIYFDRQGTLDNCCNSREFQTKHKYNSEGSNPLPPDQTARDPYENVVFTPGFFDDAVECYASSPEIPGNLIVFSDYVWSEDSLNDPDKLSKEVHNILKNWSAKRIRNLGVRIEAVNGMDNTDLADEPDETGTDRALRTAAKKSESSLTSGTG